MPFSFRSDGREHSPLLSMVFSPVGHVHGRPGSLALRRGSAEWNPDFTDQKLFFEKKNPRRSASSARSVFDLSRQGDSGLDRDPDLQAPESRPRVEAFTVTLEERRETGWLIPALRNPSVPDGVERDVECREWFPMLKNGVALSWDGDANQIIGNGRGI